MAPLLRERILFQIIWVSSEAMILEAAVTGTTRSAGKYWKQNGAADKDFFQQFQMSHFHNDSPHAFSIII